MVNRNISKNKKPSFQSELQLHILKTLDCLKAVGTIKGWLTTFKWSTRLFPECYLELSHYILLSYWVIFTRLKFLSELVKGLLIEFLEKTLITLRYLRHAKFFGEISRKVVEFSVRISKNIFICVFIREFYLTPILHT